jgi:hypothetical protein
MNAKYVRALLCASVLLSISCRPRESEAQRQADANTPAGKLGQAAHKASVEVDKAGRVLGRELNKAAHDARAGWQEAERKDQDKK